MSVGVGELFGVMISTCLSLFPIVTGCMSCALTLALLIRKKGRNVGSQKNVNF
jgi:hypothetical protein